MSSSNKQQKKVYGRGKRNDKLRFRIKYLDKMFEMRDILMSTKLEEFLELLSNKCDNMLINNMSIKYGYPLQILQINDESKNRTLQELGVRNCLIHVDNKADQLHITDFERIKIADDNSCLFGAIGFLMGFPIDHIYDLRVICSNIVKMNSNIYTEALLGRSLDNYMKYILNKDSWGGTIELEILANHFECEFAVVDIRSLNIHIFGQGKNYKQRGFLWYDGIHYDCIILQKNQTKLFIPPAKIETDLILELAKKANEQGEFTVISEFKLQCDECGLRLQGAAEAQKHAAESNHKNFKQTATK